MKIKNHLFLQSNVLEAAPDMKRESEKEWYFGNADKERRGPFSFEEVRGLLTKVLKQNQFRPNRAQFNVTC